MITLITRWIWDNYVWQMVCEVLWLELVIVYLENVSNELYLLGSIKRWDFFLSWQSLNGFPVMHITFSYNAYSVMKLFFPSAFVERFSGLEIVFNCTYPTVRSSVQPIRSITDKRTTGFARERRGHAQTRGAAGRAATLQEGRVLDPREKAGELETRMFQHGSIPRRW